MTGLERRWWAGYARLYDWLWDSVLTTELIDGLRRSTGQVTGPVLDAGTGTGLVTARLAGRQPVIGLDLSAAMLARAARRPGTWIRGDVRYPPLRPRSFDLVVAANVVHLCGSPERMVPAFAVLLRGGGRLALCWIRDRGGPWQVHRAERRRGASRAGSAIRLSARIAIGLSAAAAGGPVRIPERRILTAIAATAARHGLARSDELLLDGLVRLVVLTSPSDPPHSGPHNRSRS